jgi:hypothetical protein
VRFVALGALLLALAAMAAYGSRVAGGTGTATGTAFGVTARDRHTQQVADRDLHRLTGTPLTRVPASPVNRVTVRPPASPSPVPAPSRTAPPPSPPQSPPPSPVARPTRTPAPSRPPAPSRAPAPSTVHPAPAVPAGCAAYRGNQRIACALLPSFGFPQSQMAPLVSLWNGESGWRAAATNPSSGAYGIPQALPAAKMASAGRDWRTNPATQIRWGLGYIKARYGTPARAWAAWQARHPHWY